MILSELFESTESTSDQWYHGSDMDFDQFNLGAEKKNRGTNVAGIYLTQNKETAIEYAGDGWLYEIKHNVKNPFIENKSVVSQAMYEKYVEQLVAHTNYKEEWARTVLVPEWKEMGRMKSDLSGDIKREVYLAGGYDGMQFNDMGETVLVVFQPKNVKIINKHRAEKPAEEPEKQTKKEPTADAFDEFADWLDS